MDKANEPHEDVDAAQTVSAPDLNAIEVMMDAAVVIDEERLLERFREELFAKLPREVLESGRALQPDDVLAINSCATVDGTLVPFSAQILVPLIVEALPHLPGFGEYILEHGHVGETLEFDLTLPADYGVESLREKNARFVVQIMSAQRLTGIHDEDNFKALALGSSLDECMQRLVHMLETDLANALLLKAQDRVLRTFSSQVLLSISAEWMNQEITAIWEGSERPALEHFGFDESVQKSALAAWHSDDKTRAEVEHRLRLQVGLEAVQRDYNVQIEERALHTLLFDAGKSAGIRSAEIRENMTPELQEQADRIARHRYLVEYVMERATIRFPD